MTIQLQFASLYGGHEIFVWSNCPLDLGTDFPGLTNSNPIQPYTYFESYKHVLEQTSYNKSTTKMAEDKNGWLEEAMMSFPC